MCYEPGVLERKPRRTTARRIAGAFGLVLLLFALALVVIVIALEKIADAEGEVARLDRAKHAGHHAAAMAREQYMHQAHTLLTWDASHMQHYGETARAARVAIEHLELAVAGHDGATQAREISRLIIESDRGFREVAWPAVEHDERYRLGELHRMTEQPVQEVVALNTTLNVALERESDHARAQADDIRRTALIAVLLCFALAIAAAAAVGAYLLRSISLPVAALRAGAVQIGTGNLHARVALAGDDELADLAQVFDQMAADLARHQTELLEAQRLASIGQVASGVAHEINNPLGVMLGYVTLLLREPAFADREELRIIEDEVRQSLAIVAGLLDLARPVRLDYSDISFGEIAREAVARLEETGRIGAIEVRVDAAHTVHLQADEGKVRQIALNLITNAIEAAGDPSATMPTVEICFETVGLYGALHVDDHGPGISQEVLARVFEPFFTTRSRGHGLGLAIARTLARAHGGDVTIGLRSDGSGTRATLLLPLERADEREKEKAA